MKSSGVIPGRREAASPESIATTLSNNEQAVQIAPTGIMDSGLAAFVRAPV